MSHHICQMADVVALQRVDSDHRQPWLGQAAALILHTALTARSQWPYRR